MGVIGRIIAYAAVPAVTGAIGALAAQQMGYDMPELEGARQALLAGLPLAVVLSQDTQKKLDEALKTAGEHPYVFPVLTAGFLAGSYGLGGLAMEYLTDTTISQKFTMAVGGLEGALTGAVASAIGRNR